jgi:predicted PP-loop superfamily ATPase
MVFQVCPRMNYDAFKEFSKYKTQMEKQASAKSGSMASAAETIRMTQLKKKLMEEIDQNRKIFERRKGEHVEYGNELQLFHYDS